MTTQDRHTRHVVLDGSQAWRTPGCGECNRAQNAASALARVRERGERLERRHNAWDNRQPGKALISASLLVAFFAAIAALMTLNTIQSWIWVPVVAGAYLIGRNQGRDEDL